MGLLVAGGGFWAYEYFWARFAPKLITKDDAAIQRLLDQGDWISPGRKGAAVYMLTYRDCQACETYQRKEFPKLAAVDVDTRVLVFVRPDVSGQSLSTPVERATVAELWLNRDWSLYQSWMATPTDNWSPAGLRIADNDWARGAVVGATHAYVDKLRALLQENGLTGDDPILIWRDKRGRLKACSCTDRLSYHFVRSDFGAPDNAPPTPAAPPSSAPASPSSAPVPTQNAQPSPTTAATPAATPAETAAPAATSGPAGAPAASAPRKAPAARLSATSPNATFY